MAAAQDPLGARRARDALADRYAAIVADAPAGPAGLGVAVRTDDGWSWDHRSDRVVAAASTIKVPVLLAVLALVEQGRLRLDEPVRLLPVNERVGGAGALSLLPSVTALPLVDLLRLMVAVSDNDAANAVIEHAGLISDRVDDATIDRPIDRPIDALLAAVPTRHTRLRRRFMDGAAAARGVENETCAADLADLLVALRQGRLLGPDATRSALEVLRAQQVRDGLPSYLPPDVLVAAKPGDLPGLRAEVALLERGDRWAVVAVVADGMLADGVDRSIGVLPVFGALGELTAALL